MNKLPTVAEQLTATDEFFYAQAAAHEHLQYEQDEGDNTEALAA